MNDALQHAPLHAILAGYERRNPAEAAVVARVRALVAAHADCLLRTCTPGHLTASCWILSPDRRRFLLTHHRKLGRWLQLGGHVDGEAQLHLAALREAQEESGMEHFVFASRTTPPEPLDLDVHVIPAHRGEPAHEHHDFRYLLIAAPGQEIRVSAESHDLQWFSQDALARVAGDESVARLGRKAAAWIAAHASTRGECA